MARRRHNPLGVSWWLLGLGAAGAYYLYVRPKKAGRKPGVPEAKRLADQARYEWQTFGKGADADAVCRDRVKGAYVDDALCEKALGPAGFEFKELEAFGNYVRTR